MSIIVLLYLIFLHNSGSDTPLELIRTETVPHFIDISQLQILQDLY